MRKIILLVSLLAVFVACSKENRSLSESYGVVDTAAAVDMKMDGNRSILNVEMEEPASALMSLSSPLPPTPNSTINPEQQGKKIIYTADMRCRVQDLKASEARIKALVTQLGGYVTSSNQNREMGNLQSQMTIRVPVAKFDGFLGGSEKESIYTDYKNVSTEDVSAEYFDNELRLKSKRQAFEKYLQLLKQAKNVTEVLAVEEQLRVIREEIESKEGRQKFLDNQVAYSTVNLSIYQVMPSEIAPDLPLHTKIWETFTEGCRSLLEGGVRFFYWVPFLVLAFLLFLAFRWWRKRKL
jgi:hypothetical protein